MEKGFVYILTNPSFKDNWIKIGKSKNMPNLRAKQLSNTSVPLDYELFATLETEKFNEAEKMIHKQIEMLAPEKRINPKREFSVLAMRTEKLSMKNAIVIEFGKGFYVPVGYLDNIVKYFDVASHISKNGSLHNPDKRFTTLRINKFNCQKS